MRRSTPTSAARHPDPGVSWPGQFPTDGAPAPAGEAVSRETPARETLRTTFDFELPRGYLDGAGTLHRSGTMRLATGRDELVVLRDDRVRDNPAYLTVVLLGRVITRLGGIDDVHPGIVENLFASDLAFLQDLYRRINQEGHTQAAVVCPSCSHPFAVDVSGGRLGES